MDSVDGDDASGEHVTISNENAKTDFEVVFGRPGWEWTACFEIEEDRAIMTELFDVNGGVRRIQFVADEVGEAVSECYPELEVCYRDTVTQQVEPWGEQKPTENHMDSTIEDDGGFTTDDYGKPALRCPGCNDAWMHQSRVEVFNRDSEDDEQGIHTVIDYRDGVSVDRSMDDNPSSRRDGIKITFECEFCAMKPRTLRIVQHKGNEFVSWEKPTEEDQADPRALPPEPEPRGENE